MCMCYINELIWRCKYFISKQRESKAICVLLNSVASLLRHWNSIKFPLQYSYHTHTSIHRQYHYFLHLLVIKCILTKSKMCALFVCQLGYECNLIKRRKKNQNITDYSCCISSMTRKGSQKPNVVVVMYLKWFAHKTNDVTATQIWLLWLIR